MDAWDKQFADAGQALGLASANFKKQVANIWQFVPLVAENRFLAVHVHGCVNGTWQGRRASVTGILPVSGKTDDNNVFFTLSNVRHTTLWSEGTLLVTSVGFVAGAEPFMMAAPSAPFRVNEHKTYETVDWIPPAFVERFGQLPVPGDANGAWVVRAPSVDKPTAILNAIAPMLLSEAPYPWKIDGGKGGSNQVDLVRVDVAGEGTPPPTAELLQDRLNRLSQMAATIEQTVTQFQPGTYK
jgi:hypothetical protein